MPCASLQRKRVEFQKSSSEIQQLLLKLGFICDNDDPVGNITQIDDNAQQTIYFNGSVVSPSQKFEYDALYRLLKSTGREHVSINASSEPEAEGYNPAQISPQDGSAMRNYVREWQYDSVGNILSLIHNANGNAWTRSYDYASDSNRLNSTTVGQTTVNYTYNAHGSMTSMPHLQSMQWDFAERLCHITRGTTEAYYNYDGGGQRIRKVVEKNGVTEIRLYLGGFEIWRKTVNGVLNTERETLHVMDDKKRVAIVETLTIDNAVAVANPVPVQRYQLDNHLGSASLELDDLANVINYEEYYPYGDTSYRVGRNIAETGLKRYRYTGKEKDEESGLYYHGARYYACWLGRWTASDPAGLVDGVNLYAYVRGNPVRLSDPSGTTTEEKVDEGKVFPTFEEVETKGEGGANEKNGSVSNIFIPKEIANELSKFKNALLSYLKREEPDFEKLVKKMVSHHLSMKSKLELTTIGFTLNEIYVGYRRNDEKKSHTMGRQFANILEEKYKKTSENELTFVVHLHPLLKERVSPQNRVTMFSLGDQENMRIMQIWIGLEVYPDEKGSYAVDIYASNAEIYYEDKVFSINDGYDSEKKWIIPAVYLNTLSGIKGKRQLFKEHWMKEE